MEDREWRMERRGFSSFYFPFSIFYFLLAISYLLFLFALSAMKSSIVGHVPDAQSKIENRK